MGCSLLTSCGLFFEPQVEPATDAFCEWLEEAVQSEPKTWGNGKELTFSSKILGNNGMGNVLIVRKCYVQMKEEAMSWLCAQPETDRIGLFVVTGTPGIGKTLFLGFMAAVLAAEQKYHIVVQHGGMWWSRQVGGKTTAHYKEEPVELLQKSDTLLLADPHGGDGRVDIQPRMAGCTLVFTSPSKKSYDTPYKQQRNHSTIRYMPVWSVDEVLTHRTKLFPNSSEDQIRLGHSLLGGSLRWLGQLLNSKGDLDVAARDMVQQSMHNCTYDNLSAAASSVPSDMQGGQSHMSLLLQIHSECPFDKSTTELVESSVVEAIRDKLDANSRAARPRFINACLDIPALGSFVGGLLQDEVYEKLAEGDANHILKVRSLSSGETSDVQVPCLVRTLRRKEGKPTSKQSLEPGCIYHPKNKIFPATDLFFVIDSSGSLVLWLLQITKSASHDCKMERMKDMFGEYFKAETLHKIGIIKWVVVTPAQVGKKYHAEQTVKGAWTKTDKTAVKVEQYVSAWKV